MEVGSKQKGKDLISHFLFLISMEEFHLLLIKYLAAGFSKNKVATHYNDLNS